jgi:hypothetical protein
MRFISKVILEVKLHAKNYNLLCRLLAIAEIIEPKIKNAAKK